MKKFLSLAIGVALLAMVLSGCGKRGDEMEKLRVCEVTHSVFYAPQYVALEKGFFEEESIEIELTNGGGADKVMSALLSGSADIGFAGPEACIYVYNEGRDDPAKVFAQVTACDGSFLVGRTADPDFSWKQLAGSHILPGRRGGMPYMAFESVLRKNGLDPAADLLLDNSIQFDNMAGAFLGGTGDYVTMFEPAASALEAEGRGVILASVGNAAGEMPYTAYFAKESFLDENEELILRFTRAVYKAQQWVQQHSAAEIAQAVENSFPDADPVLLEKAIGRYQSIGAYSASPRMTEESFVRLQEVMMQAGELKTAVPCEAIAEMRFAEAVMKS